MSKKDLMPKKDTDTDQEIEAAEAPEGTPKKEKQEAVVVSMKDGTFCTFTARQNVITEYDYNEGTTTFKVVSGDVITWTRPEVKEFPVEFTRKVYMFGLLSKVKQTLAGITVDKLSETIQKTIDSIDAGEFPLRTGGSDTTPTLTDLQLAFVRAKVKNFPNEVSEGWEDTENPVVLANILNYWANLTKEQKTTIRNNSFVQGELLLIKQKEQKLNSEAL